VEKFVVDTNVIIDFLRGDMTLYTFFHALESKEISGFFSVITEMELLWCCQDEKERDKIEELLSMLERINVDDSLIPMVCKCKQKSPEIDLPDAIIAASSLKTPCYLSTRNIKHFQKTEGIKLFDPTNFRIAEKS